MRKHPFYAGWGLLMVGLVSYAQWSGMGTQMVNELKDVPKSIRDNPGAWRSHYGHYPRYVGGK